MIKYRWNKENYEKDIRKGTTKFWRCLTTVYPATKGKKSRKLLDNFQERRGYSHLKEEALDRTVLRARFGRDLDLSWDRLLNEWMYTATWFGQLCDHLQGGINKNTQPQNYKKPLIQQNTAEPQFTNAPVHEQFGSRTNFPSKKRLGWRTVSRMTNGVSDYEHASWQQRQAERIGAGVSVAG
jgi:hypothetical protein